MSDWFTFQKSSIREVPDKSRKKDPLFVFSSIMLILGGIALLFYALELREDFLDQGRDKTANQTPQLIVFRPSVRFWADEIEIWAETHSLDPILIATVIQIESCGDPKAISHVGAQGLFQVMPFHFNPDEDMIAVPNNAARGLAYLREAYTLSNGDIRRTLAGYNGGHGQITQPAFLWPEETQRYVRWGFGIYQDALSGKDNSLTLDAWLENGGWSLCLQAEQSLGLP